MIIWSGLGFLVAVITFGCCLAVEFLLDARFGEGFYSSHAWAAGLALLIGGVVSAGVGLALKSRTDREVVDVQTGERLIMNRSEHSFFFIPMHWAGIVVFAIGIGVVVYDVFV